MGYTNQDDYDSLDRRVKDTFQDGSYKEYGYNDRSEVTAATRKTPAGTAIPQLGATYGYDGIGNRLTSTSPVLGDHTYTPNELNQYATITTGNGRTAIGRAPTGWTMLVNNAATTRTGEFYHLALTAANATVPVWQSVATRNSTGSPATTTTKNFWYAKATVNPAYDFDGNLVNDGRWVYTWDAENRLIQMETTTQATTAGHPYTKLKFVYDSGGRRIARTIWKGGSVGSPTFSSNRRWIYDGWNVIAEFSATTETTTTVTRINTFTWGLDLSGTLQDAGGVGGLLAQTTAATGVVERASYDGNGNIVAWTKSTATAPTSRREYDAFGNTLVSEGTAPCNFGFSTKMQDGDTGLYYYGYRYYDPQFGRWLSRDPIEENGGINLYGLLGNSPIIKFDALGLAEQREQTVDKCIVYLTYQHGARDRDEEKRVMKWKFPSPCAKGGMIGCFPFQNNPWGPNQLAGLPWHPNMMSLMDGDKKAAENERNKLNGEQESENGENEHGMPQALDNATSPENVQKDVQALCECDCDTVQFVIEVENDDNLIKGINQFSTRWKHRLKTGPDNKFRKHFDCSSGTFSLDP